ncbi:MAG: DUF1330 domain-containing protein [Rhodospirillaceae bacterium]|nr:DUF1330 domain-containing protein [Rhodospirillaceae bacterium]
MPAYVIADIDVTDAAQYEEYKKIVPATIAQYGGKYLTRGGATVPLEGTWTPPRVVILEFASVVQAQAWYASPEYAKAKAARTGAASAKMLIVEGLPPG